ncbi:OTU domain containing 4 [Cichlidogyrus casuarinus]|uniref:OTU domain containing 4 n=1 Tax=Cichlidogyrus casuarinus TaxID=1844966 RepID=A0ABD2QLE1_9PLAT
MTSLTKILDQYHIWLKPVPRDGLCLFRAFCDAYYGHQREDKVHEIARICVPAREPLPINCLEHSSYKHYLNKLANHFNVQLIIFSVCKVLYIWPESQDAGISLRVIKLSSSRQHFGVCYDQDYVENLAFIQSIIYELLYQLVIPLESPIFNDTKAVSNGLLTVEQFNKKHKTTNNNLAVSYRVVKALHPNFYRNIEFDLWKHLLSSGDNPSPLIDLGDQHFHWNKEPISIKKTRVVNNNRR